MITEKYNRYKDGKIYKITLPINPSTDSLQVKSSPLDISREEFIEYWGEKGGSLFVSKILASYLIYLIDLN